MKSAKLTSAIIFAITASPALAGTAEVKSCAAGLSPQGQMIVQDVAPKLKPGVNVRKVLKSSVVDLVMSGKIARSDARTEGRAAAECLKKIKD